MVRQRVTAAASRFFKKNRKSFTREWFTAQWRRNRGRTSRAAVWNSRRRHVRPDTADSLGADCPHHVIIFFPVLDKVVGASDARKGYGVDQLRSRLLASRAAVDAIADGGCMVGIGWCARLPRENHAVPALPLDRRQCRRCAKGGTNQRRSGRTRLGYRCTGLPCFRQLPSRCRAATATRGQYAGDGKCPQDQKEPNVWLYAHRTVNHCLTGGFHWRDFIGPGVVDPESPML